MKKIYHILNNVNDNRISPEDTCKIDLTEEEKKRILNFIHARESETHTTEPVSVKNNRSFFPGRKAASAAVLAVCLAAAGISVGATSFHYINQNTATDYKETDLPENDSTQAEGIDGVDIEVTSISRVGNHLYFNFDFTFENDITAMQESLTQWYLVEGRNAIANDFFGATGINLDGCRIISNTYDGAECYADNVVFDGQHMSFRIEICLNDELSAQNHQLDINFKNLDMGTYIAEGEWGFTYDIDGDKYEGDIVKVDLEEPLIATTPKTDMMNTLEIDQYAITPNGLHLYGTFSIWFDPEADNSVSNALRILVWDDLGNYYLMYPRTTGLISGDENDTYDKYVYSVECDLYDVSTLVDSQEEANLDDTHYEINWNPDAATLTFAVENVTSQWDETGKEFLGDRCELISDSVTVTLK